MDEESEGLTTLDYINISYIRYFCQLCQLTKVDNSLDIENTESYNSKIINLDLEDIDRDSDYNYCENSEMTSLETPTSLNSEQFFNAHTNVDDNVFNKSSWGEDTTHASFEINTRVTPMQANESQLDFSLQNHNNTPEGIMNKNQFDDESFEHDIQNHHHEFDTHERLVNDFTLDNHRSNTDLDCDTNSVFDSMEYIRLTKSHDNIDLIDAENLFDEYHTIRRHSAPGYLHFLVCDHVFCHDATSQSDLHCDSDHDSQDALGAAGYQNVRINKTMFTGESGHLNDEISMSMMSSLAEIAEPGSLPGHTDSFSNDENLEAYFRDFSIIFGDRHVSALKSIDSAKCDDEPSTDESDLENRQIQNTIKLTSEVSPKSTVSTNMRNRKRKAKLKKKQKFVLINKDDHGKKPKKGKFADTLEELFRDPKDDLIIDDALACPVCWDVFYNPYICRPCGHVFCEPCLRKISRINRAEKRDSPCPICREPIQYCVVDYELGLHVRNHLPEEHNQRRLQDGCGKHMAHPLPSKPNPLSVAGILRRNRRLRQRFTMSPIRLDFWRNLSLVLVFLLFKACLLVIVLFTFNMANSYFSGEKLHSFSSLFNSVSLKFKNRDQPKAWFWGCAFLSGCIVLLFTTRHIYKWIRLKLQL